MREGGEKRAAPRTRTTGTLGVHPPTKCGVRLGAPRAHCTRSRLPSSIMSADPPALSFKLGDVTSFKPKVRQPEARSVDREDEDEQRDTKRPMTRTATATKIRLISPRHDPPINSSKPISFAHHCLLGFGWIEVGR